MYVCLKRFWGNVIYSALFQDRQLKFLVKITLTNAHLIYTLFCPSVCYLGVLDRFLDFQVFVISATCGCCHPCLYKKGAISARKCAKTKFKTLLYQDLRTLFSLQLQLQRFYCF